MNDHESPPRVKNPLRVAAGRMNVRLRRQWNAADRSWRRDKALRSEPWKFSTGPTTAEGRRQSAINGRKHVAKEGSRRSAQRAVGDVNEIILGIQDLRRMVEGQRFC